jgi:hypothetical protein
MKKSPGNRQKRRKCITASSVEKLKLTPENIAAAIHLGSETLVDASLRLQALSENFATGD